jgi:2-oxoglutarate ferredoxin oxidoreductase subunit alpha
VAARQVPQEPGPADANIAALNAGHAYGETAELAGPLKQFHLDPVASPPGLYRTVTGAEAVSLGLVAGAKLANLPMFFGGYPITPASAILHNLAKMKEFGVTTFQAEDEIAAICAAIGASYAGHLGVTSSSGPGIALKGEAMGLAIMTELPLVIVNSQRGGPFDRPTDQDRAVRPLPGGLRPQRRCAVAGDLCAQPGRRLRRRDRGLPDRGDST